MKIGFLQDYDIFSFPGGAEMNDKVHFKEGLKRGYDLTLFNPSSPYFKQGLLIISNCVAFDKERLKNMIDSAKTVFFFHDYIFCKYRLFYPMLENCRNCETAKWWIEQFMKASLLIWLSPLHREATLEAFPELAEKKFALIPSAVEPEIFLNSADTERFPENYYLSVNTLYPFKGRENLLTYAALHPEIIFHVYSSEKEDSLPGNIVVLPQQPYNEMPAIYKRFKNYIELPSTPQPFNRTVIEAKLSGCKIVTNKLMGAASWPWFKESPERIAAYLKVAPIQFWDAIEEVIV